MVELNWDNIRNEFETTPATLKELAEKYDVSQGTVRSRKCREKWEKKVQGGSNKTAPKKKPATQRKEQQKKKTQHKNKSATLQKKKPKTMTERIIEDVVIENKDLTEKQRLFCLYYVKYWNATKAYQKAYGCDYITANTNGPRLLVNTGVKQEIDRLKKLLASGVYLEAQAVLQKYIDIAFSDITDFVTFGQKEVQVMGPSYEGKEEDKKPVTKIVNFVDLKDSNAVDGTIITEVSHGRDGVKIKLADKMKALDKLDKYFDLFPDMFKRRIEEEKLKLEEQRLRMSANEESKETITEHARRVQEAWEKRLRGKG